MSKIVRHGGLAFLCGQTSSGTKLESIEDQTRHVLANIDALLAEAGTDKTRLRQADIHLCDMADFAGKRWLAC